MKKIYRTLLATALVIGSQTAMADYLLPGTYTLHIDDAYTGGNGAEYRDLTVTIAEKNGGYVMTEADSEYFPTAIPFTFNSATNTLTFTATEVGKSVDGNDISCLIYVSNSWGDYLPYSTCSATFSPSTGEITFPEHSVIAWPDTEMTYNEYCTYFAARYDVISAEQISSDTGNGDGGDTDGDWTNLGDALFMDGWVLPMLGIDQTIEANQWNVPLQQNTTNTNIYRLVDPYHVAGTAANAANLSNNIGYIEFDVTDPEHVLFNKVEAGFAYNDPREGEKKFNELYCVNHLRAQVSKLGIADEDIPSRLATLKLTTIFTTFENGVVYLGGEDLYGDGWLSYDAHFGTESKTDCNGIWYGSDDRPLNMTARIVFPGYDLETGINKVEKDDMVVRYFNLQGVEVKNPENGIYIMRKGGNAVKVIR